MHRNKSHLRRVFHPREYLLDFVLATILPDIYWPNYHTTNRSRRQLSKAETFFSCCPSAAEMLVHVKLLLTCSARQELVQVEESSDLSNSIAFAPLTIRCIQQLQSLPIRPFH